MTFSSTPAFPMELDRVFKITDGILRSIIICKDE
jgi:small subunit ribosomal protein S6